MTVNLFDVQDALSAEDKEREKLELARKKALARRGTVQDVIEGASNALSESSPPEAQKSSSPV